MKDIFFVIYTVIHVNDMCGERKTGKHGMPKVIASVVISERAFMQRRIT
jgi:hypothetical protein